MTSPLEGGAWVLMVAVVIALLTGAAVGWLLGYLPQRSRQQGLSDQWQRRLRELDEQLLASDQQCDQFQQHNTALQVELSGTREQIRGLLQRQSQQSEREALIQQLQTDKGALQAEVRERQVRLETERQHHVEKLALLEQSGERMQQQFRHLAQQIFDDNSRKFGSQQQADMQHLLQPLREQLSEFRRRVDDVYDKEARDRQGLSEQIVQLKQLNLQMSEDAINLTNALKGDSKTQGNWGELVLERVLEESGLRRGYEYDIQVSAKDLTGRRLQPDVVIHLPDQKDIIVDAKVSLVAYERYCSSDDEAAQQSALREHIGSIKRHIKGLSEKAYESLPEVRSLDFVLLFIPIESAFLTAIEKDRQLFGDAFERNILLVSPSTLLVTLRTINNIWRYEKQNLNAQEIAKRGGELYDKFVGFVAALDDVGKHLDQTRRAYDTAMGRLSGGKGNLINRATALKNLGVRTKKILSTQRVERACSVESEHNANDAAASR